MKSNRSPFTMLLIAAASFGGTSVAAAAPAAKSTKAAEPPTPVVTTGYVEAGFAMATHYPNGQIIGNLYEPRHQEFMLHAVEARVERAAPARGNGAGFVLEAMAGDHGAAVRAGGLGLGDHADIVQAYGVLSYPHSRLQVSVGKLASMLGNKVIQSVTNANLSGGSQFVYIENFTDVGVDAAWTGTGPWSARARIVNGWDLVTDNNTSKTVFGRVGWAKGSRALAVLAYTGSELPDSVGGQHTGAEVLANTKFGRVATTVQLDIGREEALDATWRAAGVWMTVPLRPNIDLALRGDTLDDVNGARTSGVLGFPQLGGQTLSGIAATLVIRAMPGVLIRPELRADQSNEPVFDGEDDQWTAGIGAAFSF